MSRVLRWGIGSSLLLVGGFASYLLLVYAIERPQDAAAAQELRQVLRIYGGLVTLRGLLPQLCLTLPLAALLERRFPERAGSRGGLALLIGAAALVAGLLVVSTVFRAHLPGAPRVVFSGPGNFVRTWLELSTGVFAAAFVARLLWPGHR